MSFEYPTSLPLHDNQMEVSEQFSSSQVGNGSVCVYTSVWHGDGRRPWESTYYHMSLLQGTVHDLFWDFVEVIMSLHVKKTQGRKVQIA